MTYTGPIAINGTERWGHRSWLAGFSAGGAAAVRVGCVLGPSGIGGAAALVG